VTASPGWAPGVLRGVVSVTTPGLVVVSRPDEVQETAMSRSARDGATSRKAISPSLRRGVDGIGDVFTESMLSQHCRPTDVLRKHRCSTDHWSLPARPGDQHAGDCTLFRSAERHFLPVANRERPQNEEPRSTRRIRRAPNIPKRSWKSLGARTSTAPSQPKTFGRERPAQGSGDRAFRRNRKPCADYSPGRRSRRYS